MNITYKYINFLQNIQAQCHLSNFYLQILKIANKVCAWWPVSLASETAAVLRHGTVYICTTFTPQIKRKSVHIYHI